MSDNEINPQVEQNKKDWKKRRRQVFVRFVLIVGLLWSVVTTIITQLFKLNEKTFSELYLSNAFLIKLSINLVIGIFILAPLFWFIAKNRYSKQKEDGK